MRAHRLVTAAFVLLVTAAVWQTATTPTADLLPEPTTTTMDPRIAEIERRLDEVDAKVDHVHVELWKQGEDQKAVWVRIERIAAERAAVNDVWYRLRVCESGNNYRANTGNGYYGAYQFSAPTWRSMNTGYAYAHQAPPSVQDDAARRLQARSGWGQWPACSRRLGLR